jgi:hypothetical protein
MSLLALTPVSLAGGLSALNITSALASVGSNTGVTFANDGSVFLLVVNGATPSTATVKIATTIEGQPVTSPSAYTIAANTTYTIGRFDPAFSAGLGNTLEIDFATPTTVSVVLLK